jgi:hypothetical protein
MLPEGEGLWIFIHLAVRQNRLMKRIEKLEAERRAD